MRELSLHLLDIAENSVAAGATDIAISVIEDTTTDRLIMTVEDNGKGMDPEILAKVADPFVTTRTTRKVGLGIPLLKEAAEFCNGNLEIHSTQGIGTKIQVTFEHSHIDRMPVGDLAETFRSLVIGYPKIHWSFLYQVNQNNFTFDTEPIYAILGDVAPTEPAVLAYITDMLREGISDVQTSKIVQNY